MEGSKPASLQAIAQRKPASQLAGKLQIFQIAADLATSPQIASDSCRSLQITPDCSRSLQIGPDCPRSLQPRMLSGGTQEARRRQPRRTQEAPRSSKSQPGSIQMQRRRAAWTCHFNLIKNALETMNACASKPTGLVQSSGTLTILAIAMCVLSITRLYDPREDIRISELQCAACRSPTTCEATGRACATCAQTLHDLPAKELRNSLDEHQGSSKPFSLLHTF